MIALNSIWKVAVDCINQLFSSADNLWYTLFAIVNLSFLFGYYVTWRQHKAVSRPTRPAELKELCTEEEYQSSRQYTTECSTFGLIQEFISHFIVLAILFGGLYPIVWKYSEKLLTGKLGFLGQSEIVKSLVFQGIFLIINTLEGIPFSVYKTFVIEKKHGFNKTTVKTFILDIFKSLLVGSLLGSVIFSALIWTIRRTGEGFVMWVCGLLLLVQLAMVVIFPAFIQPLFNKFTPLGEGDLKKKIEALATLVHFPLNKIHVIDGSSRSSHSNAYFFGLGNKKQIVIFDTLIEQMETDEILAIVGHELGHWAHNHMFKNLFMNQLNIIWIFSLFRLAIGYGPLYEAFGFYGEKPLIVGLTLYMQMLAPLNLLVSLIMTWLSRRKEFEADRYAIDLGYGEILPNALLKLYKKNKSFVHPDPLYSMMNYSHPPPSERIPIAKAYASAVSKRTK